MATEWRSLGTVYRLGSRSPNNFTPKPKDLAGRPGLREPGLSTLEKLRENEVGIGIDLSLLKHPLRAFADAPDSQGRPGHLAIVPVNESGIADLDLLQEWIDSRESGYGHPFTQDLLEATIMGKVKGTQ